MKTQQWLLSVMLLLPLSTMAAEQWDVFRRNMLSGAAGHTYGAAGVWHAGVDGNWHGYYFDPATGRKFDQGVIKATAKAGDKEAKPVSFKNNVPSPQDWVLVLERNLRIGKPPASATPSVPSSP